VCVPVCCRVARICVERYIGGERKGVRGLRSVGVGGAKGPKGDGKEENGSQDMIAQRRGLLRLEVCMGEGCQSCVVERDSPALHPWFRRQ
jgi:hypothetical protein